MDAAPPGPLTPDEQPGSSTCGRTARRSAPPLGRSPSVRLGKETVADQQTVGGEIRKEEIDLDTGDAVMRALVICRARGMM